jgi:transposase
MRAAAALEVSEADRAELARWVRSSSIRASLARRARIVLLAADGVPNAEIARRVGGSRQTVLDWRDRFAAKGIAGLDDAPRSGRPPVVDEAEVIARTLEPPPKRLGVTHWSTRLLAAELGISNTEVGSIWRAWGIQPHRTETFKFSTDPQLEAKIRDVVGLYLDPPERAVVLCVDEKSQVQALERTAPMLPLRPGLPAKATYDYRRHGTTTLFAALEIATGKVTHLCQPRHRHQEFLRFLRQIATTYPQQRLCIVVDNYGSHSHPKVRTWLTRNPPITLHFTPTSSSWLNMVEIFFSIITRQAIRRGSYTSTAELHDTINTYIESWNDRTHPFIWTKTADQLLTRSQRPRPETSFTRH